MVPTSSLPPSSPTDISQAIKEMFIRLALPREDKVITHLSQFIELFRDRNSSIPRKNFLEIESIQSIRRWTQLSNISRSINRLQFSSLPEADETHLFMGLTGLCAGIVVDYLSRFFETNSPLEASPFPISDAVLQDVKLSTAFYPFSQPIGEAELIQKTQKSRFLQAAYLTAYRSKIKRADTLEFFPVGILRKANLSITGREPPYQSRKSALEIEQLLPQLKKLETHDRGNGYLIGLTGERNHALTIYLHPPFHFMDPSYGLGVADHLESLLLFLINFIAIKYSDCSSFALLEFRH